MKTSHKNKGLRGQLESATARERPRLYLSVDRLSLIKVHEYGNGNSMSLWMAMEDLAFENAGTYPSKSFIIDHIRLGDRAGIHFRT